MDVLSPELVWIENRCYRVNPTSGTQQNIRETKVGGYVEPDCDTEEEEAEPVEEMDFEIERIGENSFRTSFHVPSAFHGSLIGQRGATRKRLEMETKTLIKIPSRGSQDPVVVQAQRETDVVAARKKIEDIVASSRQRNDMTHFLSIPCCCTAVKEAFRKFRETIEAGPAVEGLTDVLFQVPEKLHITLTGMTLMDDVERQLAKTILQDEEEAIKGILAEFGGKADVKISGVDCMSDDLVAARVIYAKIQSEALQKIANHLQRVYKKQGLASRKERDTVKLHLTLINASFDKDESGRPKKGVSFDARGILKEFGDHTFATIPLTEVHLSQRRSYDSEGYYKATTKLSFC